MNDKKQTLINEDRSEKAIPDNEDIEIEKKCFFDVSCCVRHSGHC